MFVVVQLARQRMVSGWTRLFVTPDTRSGDSATDVSTDVLMVIVVAVVLYVAGVSLRIVFPSATEEWETRRRLAMEGYGSMNVHTYEDLLRLQDEVGFVQRGLTPHQISVLPTETFDKASAVEEEASCAICLERYVEGDTLRILPCGERFHRECIDRWLAQSATCPLCRTRFA